MHQDEPIIINPVEHSRSTDTKKPNQSKYFTYTDTAAAQQPSYATQSAVAPQRKPPATTGTAGQAAAPQEPTPTTAQTIPPQQQTQQKSRLSGVAQIVGGGACALVGIPMLILPGPGLLAIGGGVLLMARGAKTLLGPR